MASSSLSALVALPFAGALLLSAGCETRSVDPPANELPPLPEVTSERLAPIDPVVAALVRERQAEATAQPHDPERVAAFAYALHANGLESDAVIAYRRLEAMEPDQGRWALLAARALRSLGRMDEAIASMRRAAQLGFAESLPHAYLGFWMLERGDLDASREAFDAALASAKPVHNATVGRAQIAIADGETQRAMELLGKARREVPGDRFARYLLGLCLREIGDAEGARIELAVGAGSQVSWAQQDPTLQDVHRHWVGYRRDYNFGTSLLSAGQYDRAASVLEDLHRRHLDDVPVMTALASVMIFQRRADDAVALLVRGLSRTGDHYAMHQTLGLAFENAGNLERALQHTARAAALHPAMVQVQTQYGRQLAAAGRDDEAEIAYRDAVRANPARSDAVLALAQFLIERGRMDEAMAGLAAAAEVNPGEANVVIALAQLSAEAGQRDRARQLLEQALRIQPEHAAARQLLGRLR